MQKILKKNFIEEILNNLNFFLHFATKIFFA